MAGGDSAGQQHCQQHTADGKPKELRHSRKQEVGVQSLEESAQMRQGGKNGHKVEELCDFAGLKGPQSAPCRWLCSELGTFAFASLRWSICTR